MQSANMLQNTELLILAKPKFFLFLNKVSILLSGGVPTYSSGKPQHRKRKISDKFLASPFLKNSLRKTVVSEKLKLKNG